VSLACACQARPFLLRWGHGAASPTQHTENSLRAAGGAEERTTPFAGLTGNALAGFYAIKRNTSI